MKNSPKIMFLFGVLAFIAIMVIAYKKDLNIKSAEFWLYQVLTTLAVASISISIPGILNVNYTPKVNSVIPRLMKTTICGNNLSRKRTGNYGLWGNNSLCISLFI